MEKFRTKARKMQKKKINKDTLDQTIGCTNIHNDILKLNNRFDSRKNDKWMAIIETILNIFFPDMGFQTSE